MSYLFCALVYNRKSFDPGLVAEIMSERFEPEDEDDRFVKVPVKRSIEAVFMLPLRKDGLKSKAFYDRIDFIEEDLLELLAPAIAAGRGAVSPRVMPVVFLVAYSDMSRHNMIWTVSPEGVDHRYLIEDEAGHTWTPTDGEVVARNENISVSSEDFGATEESDADFREEEYQAEVARREQPFSMQPILAKELQLKTGELIKAIARLEEGETIWPEVKPRRAKAAGKKAPAPATKGAAAGKKAAKSKPAGKRAGRGG